MKAEKRRKKFGCFRTGLAVLLVVVVGFKVVMAYLERPAALYQRWIGTEVPSDVTELDGLSKFYITESILWLSFSAPPARIKEIVDRLEMEKVEIEGTWNQGEAHRQVVIGSGRHSTSLFSFGLGEFAPVPDDLVVYWKGDDQLIGWALYYSATTRQAYWTKYQI